MRVAKRGDRMATVEIQYLAAITRMQPNAGGIDD
jgi:hypothetical protein